MRRLPGVCLPAVWLVTVGLAWGGPATGPAAAQPAQDQKPSADKAPKDKEPPAKPPLPPPPPALALETPPPAPLTGLGALRRSESDPMLGDVPPTAGPPGVGPGPAPGPGPSPGPVPTPAGPVGAVLPVPSLRGFKIADHESADPVDRAYVGFNFFNDVDESINRRFGSDVHHQRVYRETFGLEKTFLGGRASVGLRLPLNTLTGESAVPALDGSSTDVGDLSVILKFAAYQDRDRGDVLSLGLAVTAPTGPSAFADSPQVAALHSTTLQPYVGYLWNWGDLYVQGFTSIDVPTDSRDVTILYNDIGIGYHLYRAPDPGRLITQVVPTFEVHVNTPLDHRGSLRAADLAATPDVVDLTAGTFLHLYENARLGVAVVAPVTGPRPFDVEAIVHFEVRF
jgi:hypothetical protein